MGQSIIGSSPILEVNAKSDSVVSENGIMLYDFGRIESPRNSQGGLVLMGNCKYGVEPLTARKAD